MYATFTDPEGAVYELTNTAEEQGWFTTFGPAGWGARPYQYVLDPLPRGGSAVRFVRAEPARLTWPLHIHGDTHMQWLERYRAIKRAFLMTAHRSTPGVLTVARPDASARSIDVFYEDGFGGQAGENWLFANPVLTLLAPEGFWRDTVLTSEYREFSVGTPYLSPYRTVSSSQVLGATTVTNPGEVTAWPQWLVTGPAAAVTGTNLTTGQTFTLTYTLTAGQSLTITTLQPTATGPSGQNIIGGLNWPTAQLWPLMPGDNDIEFNVDGSGVGTSITLSYYPRYEGA
jgi:hypothetical protein